MQPQQNTGRTVAIIGGGIGGMTAALAFAQSGAKVTVYEQAPEISEVGAGIQITPNGARALIGLGLGDDFTRKGLQATAVQPVDALTGAVIARFDLTRQQPAYRFFHRAALAGWLCHKALELGVKIVLGCRVTSMSIDGIVQSTHGPAAYDIIVGADGIHSIMRGFCGNPVSAPTFTGQVAWRGITSVQNAPAVANIWMAPGRHVVTYPIGEGALNVVAVQERDTWAKEGWNHPDVPGNLQAAFADCHPTLTNILRLIDQPKLWGLFRHPVATHWHHHKLAILGDAAHPTLPFLAQGANLAIEDAYVLARCCNENPDIGAAFAAYQSARQPRVTRAIAAANANARNYHLSGIRRGVAHIGLKTMGKVAPDAFINRLDWLYSFDVTA